MKSGFQGVRQIVRFNWPFYAAGFGLLACGGGLMAVFDSGFIIPTALAFAAWWLAGSLVVSWWVYDVSDWSRGQWFRELGLKGRLLNVHSGFDETTGRVRRWAPEAEVQALDLFDPQRMTEASIHRARQMLPPLPGSLSGSHDVWPVAEGAQDAVLFLLSAHEFRRHEERVALFREARRVMRVGGCIIVAEHVRDVANFAAFGPGFLHFHSVPTWEEAWREAGLHATLHRRITPFLRLWRLQSTP